MKRTRMRRSAKAHERQVREAAGKLRYFDFGWDEKSIVSYGVPFNSPEGARLLVPLGPNPRCRIFFWQAQPGGSIKIGHGPRGDTKLLTSMRGTTRARSPILSVISSDVRSEAQVHRRFARLLTDPDESLYAPDQELLATIAAEATSWAPRAKRSCITASCERCEKDFDSPIDCRDRYCPRCQKLIKASLATSGYLQPLARPTWIKPDNYRSDFSERKGDPNPWQENAIKELEDG